MIIYQGKSLVQIGETIVLRDVIGNKEDYTVITFPIQRTNLNYNPYVFNVRNNNGLVKTVYQYID